MEAYENAGKDCEIGLMRVQFGMEAYENAGKDCEIGPMRVAYTVWYGSLRKRREGLSNRP